MKLEYTPSFCVDHANKTKISLTKSWVEKLLNKPIQKSNVADLFLNVTESSIATGSQFCSDVNKNTIHYVLYLFADSHFSGL